MTLLDSEPDLLFFVGRERELRWLEDRFKNAPHGSTLQIVGPYGIGKTALLQQFFRNRELDDQVLSVAASGRELDLDRVSYRLRNNDRKRLRAVAVDEADGISKQIEQLQAMVFDWKSIRALFLATIRPLRGRRPIETLEIEPLDSDGALLLLRRLSRLPTNEALRSLADATGGLPRAIQLTARMLETTRDPDNIARMLQGPVYELQNHIHVPQRELITKVEPTLIRANEQILERLRARPQDVHKINHRKFEELVAELLEDMNFDVELTQATRDGGRDVLAYWNSPVGRLLILVEAKKHRPDRTVGVQLVRTLYGTLVDEQANSAMLVTTADFSPDARTFEARHKWRLALKNYTDLVEWIENYKRPKSQRPNIILP